MRRGISAENQTDVMNQAQHTHHIQQSHLLSNKPYKAPYLHLTELNRHTSTAFWPERNPKPSTTKPQSTQTVGRDRLWTAPSSTETVWPLNPRVPPRQHGLLRISERDSGSLWGGRGKKMGQNGKREGRY